MINKTTEYILAAAIILAISQPFLNSTNLGLSSIDSMDLTLTGKEQLSEKERMQHAQLRFEREKLASDERISKENSKPIVQPSSTSVRTKTILYVVGGAFFLGTIGALRSFTRISNAMFNAKDWTKRKSKDVFNTMLYGREVRISKKEYDDIKKEIKRVNNSLEQARTKSKESSSGEEDYDIPENIEIEDDENTEEEYVESDKRFTRDRSDLLLLRNHDKSVIRTAKSIVNGIGNLNTMVFNKILPVSDNGEETLAYFKFFK